jgi:hypothetical protein
VPCQGLRAVVVIYEGRNTNPFMEETMQKEPEMSRAQREAARQIAEHNRAICRILGRFNWKAADVINEAASFNWIEEGRRSSASRVA